MFPVVFSTAVTCMVCGLARAVVVLKQTVTVPLFSGTSTLGTLGTTVGTTEERGRKGKEGEKMKEGSRERKRVKKGRKRGRKREETQTRRWRKEKEE